MTEFCSAGPFPAEDVQSLSEGSKFVVTDMSGAILILSPTSLFLPLVGLSSAVTVLMENSVPVSCQDPP